MGRGAHRRLPGGSQFLLGSVRRGVRDLAPPSLVRSDFPCHAGLWLGVSHGLHEFLSGHGTLLLGVRAALEAGVEVRTLRLASYWTGATGARAARRLRPRRGRLYMDRTPRPSA